MAASEEDEPFFESLSNDNHNSESLPLMSTEQRQFLQPGTINSPVTSQPSWNIGDIQMKDEHGLEVSCYLTKSKRFIKIPSTDMRPNVRDSSLKLLRSHLINPSWKLEEPTMIINVIGGIDHSHYAPLCLKRAIKSLFHMTKNW